MTDLSKQNLTFGQALEEVKKGNGMRLPVWKEDVVIRCAKAPEYSDSTGLSGILCNICTDVTTVIGRDLTDNEEDDLKAIVTKRLHEQMTAPFLYVESRFGRVPWKETMIELFAENWEVVE
ncbi:hypothetical protein IR083_10075 [Dysgonomonas sp. GY75]|uniref:Thoeris anti-defense Tad2 family protein n=1 Tax=Dysgonomonas sp. GY75 TaxID=2780419 RepID=UPI0018837644|nr:hypothetical protein [Dysgonomonas sp. GY75]MBF0649167.1 hypothetical protein [Dysgonomonas sp. GY75]